jgi:FAD/FMN-containing dehydrogenase
MRALDSVDVSGPDTGRLPASLAAAAVLPDSPEYRNVRSTFVRGGSPRIVLRPADAASVADAVRYASDNREVPLGIRSGGHGFSGRSTNRGGIVIDVGRLNHIEVLDHDERLVRIGPGARWGEVSAFLDSYGWALVSGDHGAVGVGGLATAGGIGLLSRKYGLTIDHLIGVEMVTAEGRIIRADPSEHSDLFWAVRGAGANFGVVTAFEFVVPQVREVGWAQLDFEVDDPAEFLQRFGTAASQAPRDATAFLTMGPTYPDQWSFAHVTAMVDSSDPVVIAQQLQPLADSGALLSQRVVITPYAAVLQAGPVSREYAQGEPHARSGFVTAMTSEVSAPAATLLKCGAAYFFQVRTLGGAIADVDPNATAYAHRDAGFHITAMGADSGRLDRSWETLRQHMGGLYLSFESTLSATAVGDAFPPATLARLRELKSKYDPGNLFADNFNITAGEGSPV